jgi:hypothetical protein
VVLQKKRASEKYRKKTWDNFYHPGMHPEAEEEEELDDGSRKRARLDDNELNTSVTSVTSLPPPVLVRESPVAQALVSLNSVF